MADESLQLLRRLRRALGVPADGGATDADLLTRFLASRDETAFELVVRRHERMVWGVCRRVLRDHQDAEDVFQATFLILARKARSVADRGSVAAWLHRVAYRAALRVRANATRRMGHERQREGLAETVADRARLSTLEWRELRPMLDAALARLPEAQRAAVVLCYLEGKTYTEAAGELGCPKGTLSIRLTRARERLRRELARLRVCLPAGLLAAALAERGANAAPPAGCVNSVVNAATAGAAVPAGVTALTKGVLRTMTLTRLTRTLAACFVVGLLGLGAGGLLLRNVVNGQPLAATRAPALQGQEPAGKEPKTPAELFKALELEQLAAMKAFAKVYQGKKTIEEKREFSNKNLPLPRFAARFIELAVKYPRDPVAEEALIKAVRGGIGLGKDIPRNRALAQLVRNHIDSPRLGEIALILTDDPEQDDVNRDFMLSVAAKSPRREVRGQACLALAWSRARVADHTDLIRKDAAERKLFETYLDPADLKRILDRDTDRLRREAESFYQLALDAYSDAAMPKKFYGPMTVGRMAKKALFVIRNLAVGQTAPEVESIDLNGRKVKLSNYRGKVVVLDVWATWCAPCRAMIPHQRELVKRLEGKPFVLISISVDKDRADVVKFQEKEPMPWVHWHNGPDGGIVEDWNVESYPTVYVLDAAGVIRYKGVRGRALDDAVDRLLKEARRQGRNDAASGTSDPWAARDR